MRTPHIVLYVFAGRRPNLELQLPFVRRILDENPYVDFDVWNLARDNGDSKFLQTIEGERITVRNEHRRCSPGYDKVYQHYADAQYRHSIFVKLDDDVVFLQTERFKKFTRAITTYPDHILSANIINNGACTPLEPGLWEEFQKLGIPLLDVHTSIKFASIAHDYFFHHHQQLLAQPVQLAPTTDWLSINAMGYTYDTGLKFAELVGTKCSPRNVAGRHLTWLGDEGVANTMPRIIMRGFLACHLSFGPQNATPTHLIRWREIYDRIAGEYLAAEHPRDYSKLPELSEPSDGQGEALRGKDWRQRWNSGDVNDPLVGRFIP
jgi:hypothetical protein